MNDNISVNLIVPIIFGTREIKEIVIKKPKIKHLKDLPIERKDWNMGHIISLLSQLSSEPPSAIGELYLQDLENIMGVIAPFLSNSQPTGEQ